MTSHREQSPPDHGAPAFGAEIPSALGAPSSRAVPLQRAAASGTVSTAPVPGASPRDIEQHVNDGCTGHCGTTHDLTAVRRAIEKDITGCQTRRTLEPENEYVRGRMHGLEAALVYLTYLEGLR